MRTKDTDISGESTDERTEKRANADPVGVDTPNLDLTESGTSSTDGAASDRTNRADWRGMIPVLGTVGVAGVTGCLGSGETWAAITVNNDVEYQ